MHCLSQNKKSAIGYCQRPVFNNLKVRNKKSFQEVFSSEQKANKKNVPERFQDAVFKHVDARSKTCSF